MRKLLLSFGIAGMIGWLLAGCSTMTVAPAQKPLPQQAQWVLLPFENLAQAPQAAERAEAMAMTFLQSRGLQVKPYPKPEEVSPLLLVNDTARYQKALRWAQAHNADYGVTGSVNEWRYKAGLDGEPAVGMTLRVVDIKTGEVVWSATAARSGWGREALSMSGQKVLDKLVDEIPLQDE